MKIIKVLIGIRDYRSCNPATFSPMKIGDYSYRIALRPLREGGDGLNWQSIHSYDAGLELFDGVSNRFN